jgi:hypothetical protein
MATRDMPLVISTLKEPYWSKIRHLSAPVPTARHCSGQVERCKSWRAWRHALGPNESKAFAERVVLIRCESK